MQAALDASKEELQSLRKAMENQVSTPEASTLKVRTEKAEAELADALREKYVRPYRARFVATVFANIVREEREGRYDQISSINGEYRCSWMVQPPVCSKFVRRSGHRRSGGKRDD